MLSDTHAHIDFNAFDADRAQVIERAKQAGLGFMINISIDLETAENSIRLARQNPGFIFTAVGIHPNYTSDYNEKMVEKLECLAHEPEVLAIGEIGLDYYRDHATPEQQRRALFPQLDLAARLHLPIILHERSSAHELVPILIEWQKNLPENSPIKAHPGVMHSYGASLEYLPTLLEAGFYFGIGGPVTYKNAQDKHSLVQLLPLERILLETDCPYLTPHPHRGERNEPAYIPYIASKIAQLKDLSIAEVSTQTAKNAFTLFSLKFA